MGSETFPGRKARERTRRFVRRHPWRFIIVFVAMLSISAVVGLLLPHYSVPAPVVALIVLAVGLGAAFPMLDGTYHLRAANDAEGWTAAELRKLRRRGWKAVNSIPFESRDVDHVLVGQGKVYAIDTKYSDSDIELSKGRAQVRGWADKARTSARSARLLLRFQHGLSSVEVLPVVAVWGPEVKGAPCEVDGVIVLTARDLVSWFSREVEPRECAEQTDSVIRALTEFKRMRRRYERERTTKRSLRDSFASLRNLVQRQRDSS